MAVCLEDDENGSVVPHFMTNRDDAHPNGEGGLAAAEKFKETFFDGKEWTL